MKNQPKTDTPQATFPQEIFVYEKREPRRYGTSFITLAATDDVSTLATARGRTVGVYKLVKTVNAVRKTTVSVQVSEKKQ